MGQAAAAQPQPFRTTFGLGAFDAHTTSSRILSSELRFPPVTIESCFVQFI
jgi:hypothetical protein